MLLDLLHRAEKRGLIASTEEFRALEEVRNVIAQDYSGAELTALLDFCRTREPRLNAACDRMAAYTRAIGEKVS